jgi:hypothetical protein
MAIYSFTGTATFMNSPVVEALLLPHLIVNVLSSNGTVTVDIGCDELVAADVSNSLEDADTDGNGYSGFRLA